MIDIQTTVGHQLGLESALNRLQHMVASLSERFPQQVHQVQIHLHDQRINVRFAAYGYMVQLEAEVTADSVLLTGQIPDSAGRFQSKITDAIVDRLEVALAPSVAQAA